MWILSVALLMICSGCKDYTEVELYFGQPVSVEMAYGFSPLSSDTKTRQAAEVIQNNLINPRLPSFLRVIPFTNDNPQPSEIYWEDPVSKTNPPARFYRSRNCNLSVGVNAVRVYGRVAPTGVNSKVYNGSLIEHFPASITTVNEAKQISFDLEPIYDTSTNGIPSDAQTLAACLNTIAQAGNWNTSTDDNMKELLKIFTNEGYGLPGSAANVRKWISSLIALIAPYLVDNPDASHTVSEETKDLLRTIMTKANEQLTAILDNNYPRNLYLPDGAAVLRWDKTVNEFVPQINTTTLENINSIALFAYPTPLYYYVSSDIKTSDEKVDLETIYNEVVSDETKTAWDKVLANEKFNKTAVTLNTRAVALAHPVQFAVAQLKVNIKAFSTQLLDAENTLIDVTGNRFQLTGIIVCDQRPVNYRFEPKEVEQGNISHSDVLFIYDNQVKENCYLLPQAEGVWAEGCSTMVLQSLKDENVNIILEFENKSGAAFSCIDGMVYPDTRFYMIGRVEATLYNTPDQNVNDENRGQVFTKDYITTVNMTVSSLAKAYNVPPNLLSPNLEIGVETTPQWEGATPTVIRLE